MVESTESTTRKRPRKNGAARQVDNSGNGEPAESKARAKALYHVFSEDEDSTLSLLGQFQGRNASEAIEAYAEAGNEVQGITFVVVPNRNLARVRADVETKTKVKLSAV